MSRMFPTQPPTETAETLLALLKRALPMIQAAENLYAYYNQDERARGANRLQAEIVDELLARDIKPFDEYENPEEAVTDEALDAEEQENEQ